MMKVLGIVLILSAGALGFIAYDAYKDRNVLTNKAESALDSMTQAVGLKKIEVSKEIPQKTMLAGAGALVSLVVGLWLVSKK